MQKALSSLPGVEKDSIKVSLEEKSAVFCVTEPGEFDVDAAVKTVDDLGFDATLAKKGDGVGKK